MQIGDLSAQDTANLVAAVAAAMKKGNPSGRSNKSRKQGGSRLKGTQDERKAAFAEATKLAFQEAGYGDVVLNEDVLSYGKWEERGFRVKKGEKAVRIKTKFHRRGAGLPLFHHSQVEKISA